MITILAWSAAAKALRPLTPAELPAGGAADLAAGDVVWIDLAAPTADEEAHILGRFLPIHPLLLEDVARLRREPDEPPHLPKVEEFPDYLFVIVNPLRPPYLHAIGAGQLGRAAAERPLTQLSAVLNHRVLVTHHAEPLPAVDRLRDHLGRHPQLCDRGPDYLFHLLLDDTVDQFVPVLDAIQDALDAIEGEVLTDPRPALFARLLHLKRRIVMLRKTLIYEREVLVRLARGEFDLVDERETAYYRNVYDHLVRFTELIESAREMVSDLMQTHLAATGNRLNAIMKVLAMISTVGVVCTIISGIYGMNFDHMPETKWVYGYPFALGLMATAVLVTLGVFRWKKWL